MTDLYYVELDVYDDTDPYNSVKNSVSLVKRLNSVITGRCSNTLALMINSRSLLMKSIKMI